MATRTIPLADWCIDQLNPSRNVSARV